VETSIYKRDDFLQKNSDYCLLVMVQDLCWCKQQGLYLGGTSVAVLESCSVYQNGGHGILVMQGATNIDVTKSKVSYNQGAALVIDQGVIAKVQNNDLRYNMQGPCLVGVQSQHLVSVTNNLTT